MMQVAGSHYYSSNQRQYVVSLEAAKERRDKWSEIPGYGTGSARVSHPDWLEVYNDLDQSAPADQYVTSALGRGYHVCALAEDDILAFIGVIYRVDDTTLELAG